MPPQTRKAPDLDALAYTVRMSILLIVGTLTSRQGNGQIKGEVQAKAARPDARVVDVQFNPSWLYAQSGQNAVYNDIWGRMRDGFQLQDTISTNPHIERWRLWFLSNRSFLEQLSTHGGLYMHYVVKCLEEHGMLLELALLPTIESTYNPFVLSCNNAVNLWQLIPVTDQHLSLRQTNFYDGRRDITTSTNAALTYLERLHDMFNGDWMLALAVHNIGEDTVSRAIEHNEKLSLSTDYWNLSLPQETQDYILKLFALSQIVMAPDFYGISLNPINNEPCFQAVRVKHGIDLSDVAALADLDEDELCQLNPAYKRHVIMDGPQRLLMPMEKAVFLTVSLDTLKSKGVTTWQQYRVRSGDSPRSAANRYRTAVAELKSANRLPSSHLCKNQWLSIPGQITGGAVKPVCQQLVRQASTPARTRSYKAKNGDDLWQIAHSSGVDVNDLKRWNGLDRHALEADQTFKLQGGTQILTARKGDAAGERDSATYYEVKQGNSMYLVARCFNVEMKHLQRWNPRSKQALKPGQTLTPYLDITGR